MTIAMNDMTDNATALVGRKADRDWWRGAVIYQIYPRSFQDTSGDGIGAIDGEVAPANACMNPVTSPTTPPATVTHPSHVG